MLALLDEFTTGVLIAGAGAAGLTLAIEIARRGVSFRLIDRLEEPFRGSRGKGIQPRTLEVFEDLGILDRVAARGGQFPPQRQYRDDGTHDDTVLAEGPSSTPEEPHRWPLLVPQFATEAIMRERLAEFGHSPEYGRELRSIENDPTGIVATVSGRQGDEVIRARYLVGTDGGRSFVRHALGIGFPGKTLGVRACVADVRLEGLSRDAWLRPASSLAARPGAHDQPRTGSAPIAQAVASGDPSCSYARQRRRPCRAARAPTCAVLAGDDGVPSRSVGDEQPPSRPAVGRQVALEDGSRRARPRVHGRDEGRPWLDCERMPPESPHATEREQTDESLRVEREKADQVVGEQPSTVEEKADALILLARQRADALLAATRARTDRAPSTESTSPPAEVLRRERRSEDQLLQEERDTADEALRGERAEHAALLAAERAETDKDLLAERARSDVALATRDEFLGLVSHDLRNMLHGIVGFAEIIASDLTDHQPVEPFILHARRIERSGARMNRLIGDLLDIASIEAGKLAVTRSAGDPAAVVAEVVEFFQVQAATAGITLEAHVVAPASRAVFDAARILQVLANLVSNALKFTPAGGQITVQVESRGDEMRFAVRDTGMGIPADQLEAVFGRFVQVSRNDRRGVGLGLYISNCIVQGHGGRLWVESELGQGSTFRFTLPVHPAV